LERANDTRNILKYTQSGGKSDRVITKMCESCRKDLDKIKSSETKLELVVKKITN
jgi:hypothetical protein